MLVIDSMIVYPSFRLGRLFQLLGPIRSVQNVLPIKDCAACTRLIPITQEIAYPLPKALPNTERSGLILYFKCNPPCVSRNPEVHSSNISTMLF